MTILQTPTTDHADCRLAALRRAALRLLIGFLWLHVAAAAIVAAFGGAGGALVPAAIALLAAVPTILAVRRPGDEGAQLTVAVSLALAVALIVFQLSGHPWQIDAHMQFFAAFACVAILCNIRALLLYAGVVAVHHLALNVVLPLAVFPGGADLGRVLVHAVVVVIQAAALIWLAASLQRAFAANAAEASRAEAAADAARRLAEEAEARRVSEAERQSRERARQSRVVRDLEAGLQRLATGDLCQPIDSPASSPFPEEYEAVRQAYNSALRRLSGTLSGIAAVAGAVRGHADDIGRAAATLSSRTETQAATLEQSAAALNELAESVRSTAERAGSALQESEANQAEAQAAEAVVREAIAAMQAIERSADRIQRIIGVIEDIAFQTNLLALNAGVEAARAGDAGRGFAVVASEVRALARRAAESAHEIKGLIAESGAHVQTGSALVSRTGQSLERTLAQASAVSRLMGAIATAAAEQAAGLAEVNAGVAQLDHVTQTNAAVAEEATAAAAALTERASDLALELAAFRIGAHPERDCARAAGPVAAAGTAGAAWDARRA
jgi:methyl-accepting chemotaxis protein